MISWLFVEARQNVEVIAIVVAVLFAISVALVRTGRKAARPESCPRCTGTGYFTGVDGQEWPCLDKVYPHDAP